MTAEEFQTLKDSIADIGVQTAVTVFEGAVIDGWHRWTAALELGIHCPTVELAGVDPVGFVRAANKARRHLTKSQIAMVEVALTQWRPQGRTANSAAAADLPTAAEIAARSGVSVRTIEHAKAVTTKATPSVVAAVKAGEMSVEKAAATTRPPVSALPAAVPPSIVAQRAPGPATVTKPAELNPAGTESKDDSGQPDAAQLLDELNEELRAAQGRIETLERALQADDAKAQTLIAIKRAEHAERRTAEVMQDSAAAKRRGDFYERQLARIGKAIGEKDLDRVAPAVEAMAREAKQVKA
jgi:hypothetical protein